MNMQYQIGYVIIFPFLAQKNYLAPIEAHIQLNKNKVVNVDA